MPTAINPANVNITFGPQANRATVTAPSAQVISEIVANAGGSSCLITSTARSPVGQARAMYDNLQALGVASQRRLYAAPGNQVIDTYVASKAAGKTPDQIKADMTAKINQVGPGRVSHHCADPATLCVVDIAPSSIGDQERFIAAVNADSRVTQFFLPPRDPAFHLEIPVAAPTTTV